MNENKCKDIKLPPSEEIEMQDDIYQPQTDEKQMANRLREYQYLISTRYSRVSEPDKDLLSELVVKAKGPGRTMKQFAEEIGTTPSTLSRLVNKQNKGPNSDDLIVGIAAHADPDSGVTFEQMAEAHGMAERELRKHPGMIFQEEAQKVIINELYIRKYTIVDSENVRNRSMRMLIDFSLKTNALQSNESFWGFVTLYTEDRPEHSSPPGIMIVDRRITQIMALYYMGDCPFDKISVVISSKTAFNVIKQRMLDRLDGRKLKDDISIILLDMEKGSFVEEFIIPNESSNNPEVFFPIENTSSEKGESEEDDDESLFGQRPIFLWD